MSVNMDFDFSNIENELNNMVKDIAQAENEIIFKSTELVMSKMQGKVRVSNINDPGYVHIKDGMKMSKLKDDGMGTKFREIYGDKKTGYKWKWLEFGTVKMKAIPFMQPSVDETELERQNITNDLLKKVVEK